MPGLGFSYVVAVVFVVFYLLYAGIKVVREYQRLVVFRLGKFYATKGPGIVYLVPIIDRAVWVDLREVFLEIPSQTCITRDNAPVNIDFLIYSKVVDPGHSVIAVGDYAGAARGIATTTLRAVIGDISLDDVLARREQINQVLRTKMDEVTERWGVKVTTVEIREILPPKDVQEAMTRQMSAERTRRAVVTEADGKKQATITVAEGDKQSAILRAEGDRQAAVLRAEGFSLALGTIFKVAQTVDSKTMALQYLDTLKALGAGPATKFIFPMEFSRLLGPLGDMVGRATEPGGAKG
jgi:regulator of protease activity HflC (stomatin/prohibitin superfamily)